MSRARLNARRSSAVARIPSSSRLVGWLTLLASLGAALAVVVFAARAAHADYRGPDENPSQAYGPLQGNYTYPASVQGSDQDWYYFYVPAAGDQLHWTVSNTTAITACPPSPGSCEVYATLEDSKGQQLGGADSSAGTSGVMPSTTQTIDWTFDAPGKYYLAVIGDGQPVSYQFSVTPASGLSSTPPGGGASAPSLHLTAKQHGRDVDVGLVVPSSGSRLDAHLYTGAGHSQRTAGGKVLADLQKGALHFTIALNSRTWSALQKHHRLTLMLRITLTPGGGAVVHASQKLIVTHR
jgi:hypothetical protein